MDNRIRTLAQDLGAQIVAELPDVGHGGLGAAHYAAFYRKRLEGIRKQHEAEPTLCLPLKQALHDALDQLAATISEPGKQVTREDVALLLLIEAVERMVDRWVRSLDANTNAVRDDVDQKKAQLEIAKRILCEAIGLIPPRSAAG